MQSNKMAASLMVLAMVAVLSGCASSVSDGASNRYPAGRMQDVRLGHVESVHQILIEGTQGGVGTVSGSTLGGLAGGTVGTGAVGIVGAIGGGMLGSAVGSAIEEDATRQSGMEITVRLDDGEMITVIQSGDNPFRPGDRVKILINQDGVARVARHY